MPRPDLKKIPEWYHRYVNQVKGNDFIPAMQEQTPAFVQFLKKLPHDKRDYRYAKGKWTIKELLQHIIDAERIFAYRALCFARKDKTSLPSFDENDYAANSKAGNREWNDLLAEFKAVRQSSELMFGSFDKSQISSFGIANNNPVSVNAIGFIMVGHVNHHINIIRERYLLTP
jgi:DinB superfamily